MTYLTTAIDYTNGKPHLGHAYEKTIADVFARWARLRGEDVFFSIGTDEHGQKVWQKAKEQGKDPKALADELVASFKDLMQRLRISHNRFVRTTDKDHADVVKELIVKVKDDIYKGTYEGWYCWGCEAYYTAPAENNTCPECGKPVEFREEESYFFKLSKYQDQLIAYLEGDVVVPKTRKNEILNRLKEPLRDLSISRLKTKLPWGIPFPLDENHITYVWFDALANYLTSPGADLEKYWPADVHVVGKDILWFHAVIWPAMLLSAGHALPKHIYTHGFVNDANGEKMSKSKGNVIDPLQMLDLYGSDAFRYYLCRAVVSGEDGKFDEEELIEKYNGELANELGNLVQRAKVLVIKSNEGKSVNDGYVDAFGFDWQELDKHFQSYSYNRALEVLLSWLHRVNQYINEEEPWKKDDNKAVLYNVLEGIRSITCALSCFIPQGAERIAADLGFSIGTFTFGEQNYALTAGDIIFPKIEISSFPLNLRVGKILSVEKVEGADKLYVEQVDLGNEKRQIVSGLASFYTPEELIGKHIVVVCNLKPAKLRGVLSKGMLLAASLGDTLKVVESSALPGTPVLPAGKQASSKQINFKVFEEHPLSVKEGRVVCGDELLLVEGSALESDMPNGSQVK